MLFKNDLNCKEYIFWFRPYVVIVFVLIFVFCFVFFLGVFVFRVVVFFLFVFLGYGFVPALFFKKIYKGSLYYSYIFILYPV